MNTVVSNAGILVQVAKSKKRKLKVMAGPKEESKPDTGLEKLKRNLPGKKSFVMVSCVSLAFVISYTPIFVWFMLTTYELKVEPWVVVTCEEMAFLNSIWNPFVYTILNGRFRNFAKRSLRRIGSIGARRRQEHTALSTDIDHR